MPGPWPSPDTSRRNDFFCAACIRPAAMLAASSGGTGRSDLTTAA